MNNQSDKYFQSPFSYFVEARLLDCYIQNEKLLTTYASSDIKVLPYQIAAAQFALRSRYLKGCVLCDEGSLGKTYEALLIASQKWYETRGKILVILPDNLILQWFETIKSRFSLPVTLWENRHEAEKEIKWDYQHETYEQYQERDRNRGKGFFLISYAEAVKQADEIEQTNWDLVIFDEADCLFKPENKSVIILKKAVGDSFKLLLTPTPITLSIMDIYGLIHFIDDSVLIDAEEFYRRYFRKPEKYHELSAWVSRFAFRTLKNQVAGYVNFTNRLPIVVTYDLNDDEKKLYELVEKYLKLPQRVAYPEMDIWRLSMLFYHTLSSSAQAFGDMLEAPIKRTEGAEKEVLLSMQSVARQIQNNSKADKLIELLKPVFVQLKQQKENQKALIFVENLATMSVLSEQLKTTGYGVLTYKDENAMERFRNDDTIQILISNDVMAKGLDIEFCPVVVNYDLLYNAVEMEQRICRCHRQGQESDVLVINLINKDNVADVRIVELLRKRVLQFDGIFGMSDAIMDNFDVSIADILKKRRSKKVIEDDFATNLKQNRAENEQFVQNAENVLFTTFTKNISEKIKITPKYITEKCIELEDNLWKIAAYYFNSEAPENYVIDDETKTITLKPDVTPPELFYYWTGTRHKLYTSLKKYAIGQNVPFSYRITPGCTLMSGIIENLECYTEGKLTVDSHIEPCSISFYDAELIGEVKGFQRNYNVLTGKTQSGRVLSHEECLNILRLPVVTCETSDQTVSYRTGHRQTQYLTNNIEDPTLAEELRQRYFQESETYLNEDIGLINLKAAGKKAHLDKELAILKGKLQAVQSRLDKGISDYVEELKAKKQYAMMQGEIRKQEAALFMEQMKIDVASEQEIEKLKNPKNLKVDFYKLFSIQVSGNE